MRRLSSISLSLLLLLGLSACGQKGPLTLPPEPKAEQTQAQ
jgi:predicted small lipoprotein YifL